MKPEDFDSSLSNANISKLSTKFGLKFMVVFEQTVFALTDAFNPSYAGGQWAWASEEFPLLVPVRDGFLTIEIPSNMYRNKNTDPDAYGHAVSLAAYSEMLNRLNLANETTVQIYRDMKVASLETLSDEQVEQYLGMID